MNLSGEKVNKAWEDYRKFLELGHKLEINPGVARQVEQAFKMGFSYGKQAGEKIAPVIQSINPATAHKIKTGSKNYRTDKQIRDDADFIKTLLKGHVGPMKLQDIGEAGKAAGKQWNKQSLSGFVQSAMELHPAIKKVGHGLYEYQQ